MEKEAEQHTEEKKKTGLVVIVVLLMVVSLVFVYYSFQGSSADSLCNEFKESSYKISCDEAVATALKVTNGTVQDISIESIMVYHPSVKEVGNVSLWMIDIKPIAPYFDSTFKKEIKLLRVGIGVNESIGVYRKPLEA